MVYSDNFTMADDFIAHLDGVMNGIADPYIQSRYLGFVALTAVTVFELSIKEVLCTFATRKHVILGNMTRSKMEQINGRIKLESLQKEFIKPFGEKYLDRFRSKLEMLELSTLIAGGGSIKSSYGNIIQWRHDFVHQGRPPSTANYGEVKATYQRGKEVIHCLNASMVR
jgi:hypothetical protein